MNLQNQTNLSEPKILESSFDKKKLQAGILHVGVGNFHRSHQAYLIDQLIEKKSEYQWGIIGLNLIKSGEKDLKSLKDSCSMTLHSSLSFCFGDEIVVSDHIHFSISRVFESLEHSPSKTTSPF